MAALDMSCRTPFGMGVVCVTGVVFCVAVRIHLATLPRARPGADAIGAHGLLALGEAQQRIFHCGPALRMQCVESLQGDEYHSIDRRPGRRQHTRHPERRHVVHVEGDWARAMRDYDLGPRP
jgi:hypothetical protein